MSKDLENIAFIENKIGIKLKCSQGSLFFTQETRATYMLDEFQNVVGLNLCNCSLSDSDIYYLKLLLNLTKLDLSGNEITNISVLQKLRNLTQIDLSGTKIKYIDYVIYVLQNFPNLTQLDLCRNNITDLTLRS